MRNVLRNGGALAGEYPLIFDDSFTGSFVTAEEGEDVRATCATLTRELVTPAATFKVGLIGSVATHPEWRGQGLASEVLNAAQDAHANAGCVFSMLWADDSTFYMKRGYLPLGAELDFCVQPDKLRLLPATDNVRKAAPADLHRIQELYEAHPERVNRSEEETAALLEAPDLELLVCEAKGAVAAYSCIGRGMDFTNVVHEWGGDAQHVLALVRAHMTRRAFRGRTGEVFLVAPPSATDLRDSMALAEAPSARGMLGMGRIANLPAAADLLGRVIGDEGEVRMGEFQVSVRGPSGERSLDCEELLQVLCAGEGERTQVVSLEEATGLELEQLPLLPFVWGLDSI